jgi:hypothetical protein
MLKRVAISQIHSMRFKSLFYACRIAKPLHSLAQHALEISAEAHRVIPVHALRLAADR